MGGVVSSGLDTSRMAAGGGKQQHRRDQVMVAAVLAASAAVGAAAVMLMTARAPPRAKAKAIAPAPSRAGDAAAAGKEGKDGEFPLLALPDGCHSVVASYLGRSDLLRFIESCHEAAAVGRPCVSSMHIGDVRGGAGYVWGPAMWERAMWKRLLWRLPGATSFVSTLGRWSKGTRLLQELSSLLPKLPGLARVDIVVDGAAAMWALETSLGALQDTGATRRLRHLGLSMLQRPDKAYGHYMAVLYIMVAGFVEHRLLVRDARLGAAVGRLLARLAAMMEAGELREVTALEVKFSHLPEGLPLGADVFAALAHANAPPRLTVLRLLHVCVDVRAAVALADALEARAARGCPGLVELRAGNWLQYPDPARRILRHCLPSLRQLTCLGLANEAAIEALAHALQTTPAPRLEELEIMGQRGTDTSPLMAALHDGAFPALTFLMIGGVVFSPAGLGDLTLALQHNLLQLESLALSFCFTGEEFAAPGPGLGTLVDAFLHGGGARLRRIKLEGIGHEYAPFDEHLAAAIEAGACPMLECVHIGARGDDGRVAQEALAARRAAQQQQEQEHKQRQEEAN